MPVVYVCHPVSGNVPANLARARRWLHWLISESPGVAYIAPWIVDCEIFDDADPEQRAAGLVRDIEVVRRCDAVVLVGGRVSQGMARERDAAIAAGIEVIDMTELGEEPPEVERPRSLVGIGDEPKANSPEDIGYAPRGKR